MSPAPCDWDQESYCVEEDCRRPASHRRLTGMEAFVLSDGDEVHTYELVCCEHAEDPV